jgi:lysophospholipase L1-like esterase
MKLISLLRTPVRSQSRFQRVAVAVALMLGAYLALPARVGAAGTAVYAAFGDSIAFGAFAPIGRGYVPLYAKAIATDNGVFVSPTDLGVPGWTSQDLLNALQTKLVFRLAAFTSNVITWNIGGNDLSAARNQYKAGTCGGADHQDCLHAAVAALKNNWDGILQALLTLRHGRPTILRTMDIYNPFVAEDKASDTYPPSGPGNTDFDVFKPYLDDINAYIVGTSTAHGALVAQVYDAFNGPLHDQDPGAAGLLAFDDFHPNAAGHALIASRLRALGYLTVTP